MPFHILGSAVVKCRIMSSWRVRFTRLQYEGIWIMKPFFSPHILKLMCKQFTSFALLHVTVASHSFVFSFHTMWRQLCKRQNCPICSPGLQSRGSQVFMQWLVGWLMFCFSTCTVGQRWRSTLILLFNNDCWRTLVFKSWPCMKVKSTSVYKSAHEFGCCGF